MCGARRSCLKLFFDLTKIGIVVFVLVTGAAGFAMSARLDQAFEFSRFVLTLFALYFFSSGSFAINQAQEEEIDRAMPRTEKRPIPSGRVSTAQAWVLGGGFICLGGLCGALVNLTVVALGLATVLLYNGFYTLWWKKSWAFAAVPGAIPGAMPVLIGYAANDPFVFRPEPLYLFLLMFLWQMPHFWSLAIRFGADYARGGIPVLPTQYGVRATLFQIGLYTFAYLASAAAAPFFTSAKWAYVLTVLPMCGLVLWQFVVYLRSAQTEKPRWIQFFLTLNLSVLVFLGAPVVDRWSEHAVQVLEWQRTLEISE